MNDDPETPESDDREQEAGSMEPSISTRFLWVLLGVMITMVALPMLPVMLRNIVAVMLVLWLAYEFWRFVYRGSLTR
jgi:hypothetical protein